MRIRFREWFSGATAGSLLIAAFVLWPGAAVAAQASKTGADQAARAEWSAALENDRAEARASLLSLRLFGGFSRAEAGDMNKALDGYFEVFKLYEAHGFGTTAGDYQPLRDGYQGGADLVLQVTPHIGIGVGAGYLRMSESSRMTFTLLSEDMKISTAPTLSAIPIRVGLFLTLPVVAGLNLTAGAGAAAYAQLKLDSLQRLEESEGEWTEWRLAARRNAPLDDIGYWGSLGLELNLSRNTGFFIEALARYARLGTFDTATLEARDNDGDSETVKGRLFMATYASPEASWSTFIVAETPPEPQDFTTHSELRIDLGGFSLQAGFRIRL